MAGDSNFEIPKIDVEFVENFLKSLILKKAVGVDGISSQLLKVAYSETAPSITYIMNLSIQSGKFPSKWKMAEVIHLFLKVEVLLR